MRRQDSISIATSGGLDSSILAALVNEFAEIPVQLVAVAAHGSSDSRRARFLARHLDLPLAELVLTRRTAQQLLDDLVPTLEPEAIEPELAAEWNLPPDS